MNDTMLRRFRIALVALVLAASATTPLAAASKEQQQMMADLRMLQEQSQILQNLIGSMMQRMDDAVTKLNQRLDEQGNSTRKSFADQKLVIDGLSNDLRVVREKVDDNNVRIGSLGQEVETLRRAVQQINLPPPSVDQTASAALGGAPGVPPIGAGLAAPGEPVDPATIDLPPNIPLGASPQRIYDTAWGDYTGGQYDLAISGFQAYIMTAPTSDMADNAQVFIGNSYLQDGQNERAVEAYDRAIRTYPNGDAVPEAYLKRGFALANLGEQDRARESLEYVTKTFPDSPEGILAGQRLQQLP
jgi:tol-pal system protein YbgF